MWPSRPAAPPDQQKTECMKLTKRRVLDLQHAIACRIFGKLALAPVNNPKRVLDIGTGMSAAVSLALAKSPIY